MSPGRDGNDIDKERMIKEISRCLSGFEDLLLGYLQGSFLVRNDVHDIDIGILLSRERKAYELFKYSMTIASDLERCITPRFDVDLRILNNAPVEFQYEVVRRGRAVFARDEGLQIAFEADVMANRSERDWQTIAGIDRAGEFVAFDPEAIIKDE
ncbi:nucleotidyltransferase domain-containing protein [Methanofollis tationis]|uniref:Nucleotidyltransferase domain-containing protein n=1 Tax=Methanofollis tationis TaxID=81417 RepID=A0A7K4HM21_9EURY|nr:nucleotidyltransferase domain-containing protein [Methanofollis tationis]NVO65980.1 nucleotidyltransferase domain-containing protein [Methanofollis tationis]